MKIWPMAPQEEKSRRSRRMVGLRVRKESADESSAVEFSGIRVERNGRVEMYGERRR